MQKNLPWGQERGSAVSMPGTCPLAGVAVLTSGFYLHLSKYTAATYY